VQALEGLQGLAVVCKLHGSGTHRCRDKKDHQFIAMEVRFPVGPWALRRG